MTNDWDDRLNGGHYCQLKTNFGFIIIANENPNIIKMT